MSRCASATCGCCEGVERLTPLAIANRPGLAALVYRVGTHASFFETMRADLSSRTFPPLAGLTTRLQDDPSVALLDAWATVADILTFYQERIANEGYLRTATERRSVLELARLVGYRARPGLAASVYLAFGMEEGHDAPILLGTRAQSVPGAPAPGQPPELPQAYETAEQIHGYHGLNAMKPRLSFPQPLPIDAQHVRRRLYLKGLGAVPRGGEHLLFVSADERALALYRVTGATPLPAEDRVRAELRLEPGGMRVPPQTAPVAQTELAARITALAAAFTARAPRPFPPNVVVGTELRDRALAVLGTLSQVYPTANAPALLAVVQGAGVLPQLRVDYALASARSYRRLGPWLGELVRELETIERDLISAGAIAAAQMVTVDTRPLLIRRLEPLTRQPSLQPAGMLQLGTRLDHLYADDSDLLPRLFTTLFPETKEAAYAALSSAPVDGTAQPPRVAALRVRAPLFGHNAPLIPTFSGTPPNITGYVDPTVQNLPVSGPGHGGSIGVGAISNNVRQRPANQRTLDLDAEYDQIQPGDWVVIENRAPSLANTSPNLQLELPIAFRRVERIEAVTIGDFGLSNRVTRLTLDRGWPSATAAPGQTVPLSPVVRGTTVYAQNEPVELADLPERRDVGAGRSDEELELDGLFRGLAAGRWVIVAGDRTDVLDEAAREREPDDDRPASGVRGAELAMVASVRHAVASPSAAAAQAPADTLHTFIRFAAPLRFRFKRDTVTIYGNVVRATHGETRAEVLGSGDGSTTLQRFTLHHRPLTYLAAPTPAGAATTLEVRVDGVRWHEVGSLAWLSPTDHAYATVADAEGTTSVVFGDGRRGARLPTGLENVTATYRSGIGTPGNVEAGRITLLATRPLGLRDVTNPLPASGGADPESRDQARRNAPLAVMALDRLVSLRDYADFARTFAGIAKASAVSLPTPGGRLVHVTVAGADDARIDATSDLYLNLVSALRQQGDPFVRVVVDRRELRLLVLSARVRIHPDYLWDVVEPRIRAALLDAFGFERRELGQDVTYGEVVATIHAVAGVDVVDLDALDAVDHARLSQPNLADALELLPRVPADSARPDATYADGLVPGFRPAQLAILTPDVRATLVLQEIAA